MDYKLSDATFEELSTLIQDRTGIYIPASKKYLIENRLIRVLEENNLNGYDEYLYLLKYSPNGRTFERLYDAITTNETYFFREPAQFDVFLEYVVPRAIKMRGGDRAMKVWCAACSSGEEPYTLSMVMSEHRRDVRMDIVASDISNKVLSVAERAVYGSYSVRNIPDYYLQKYFVSQGREFVLDPSVRKSVRFKNHNLLTDRLGMDFSNLDVVFCRNVLIYFDGRTKQDVVSAIYDSLKPGGVLIIGSSESLHSITRAFRPVTINRVVLYEKR